MRKITSDNFQLTETPRVRKSRWSECELNQDYAMSEGIDYRTDSSETGELPKETSLKLSLKQYAKSWSKRSNKNITVSIVNGTARDTQQRGLKFTFVEAAPATESTTN